MGPLNRCSSAHIGNYPLAFVGPCPFCPTTPRRHCGNHLRELLGRRLSLFSFFLFTAISTIFGYLRNSAHGNRATTETADNSLELMKVPREQASNVLGPAHRYPRAGGEPRGSCRAG